MNIGDKSQTFGILTIFYNFRFIVCNLLFVRHGRMRLGRIICNFSKSYVRSFQMGNNQTPQRRG